MTDRVTTFVDAVHVELAKPTLHGIATEYVIGAKLWATNAKPPMLKWKRGDIDHDVPKVSGGDIAPIFTRNQTLIIAVWDVDEEAVDLLFDNMIRAVRIAAGGTQNMKIGRFSWLTEEKPGWLNCGAALQGFIVADLDLAASPIATVSILIGSQTHSESLDV